MTNKTEYFNAKYAGDYLGDQWVVRGSDFDNLESYHHRLREALEEVTENLEHSRMMVQDAQVSSMLFDSTQEARALLAELDNMENGS